MFKKSDNDWPAQGSHRLKKRKELDYKIWPVYLALFKGGMIHILFYFIFIF